MTKSGFLILNAFRTIFIFYSISISFVTMSSSSEKVNEIPNYRHKNDVDIFSSSQSKFSRDLYLALAKEKNGNLFFSPFSISAALAMTYLGAAGNTEEEVKNVFHFPGNKESLMRAFQDMIANYKQAVPQYQLNTSNMAYISDKLSVIESFISNLKANFFSTSKTVNFQEAETIRQEINNDVEKETNSKIKDIIPPGILSSTTEMVLVNAIYFKGLWLHQFDPIATQERPFWIKPDKSINVPMMSIKKDFRVASIKELDAKLLAMEYEGGRISFVILLPNKRDGLKELEQKLAGEDIALLHKRSASQKTIVTIPKFKLEESLDLIPTLYTMGVNDLFSPLLCNLSGITEDKGIFISHILHKAFLEVNEEGSEAAAATAVMASRSMSLRENFFVADHPFIFYIWDAASATTLFLGRWIEPENV